MFYLLPGRLPGAGVGGPGALTGGENRLPPVGLIDFSVGAGGGGAGVAGGGGGEAAGDVVAGVVGVVGSGAFSSRAQAESTPMAMIAPMPAVATRRRAIRPDLMMRPICIENLNYIVLPVNAETTQHPTCCRYSLRLATDGGSPTDRGCQGARRDWQQLPSFFSVSYGLSGAYYSCATM
jgi:hypothetical protein